MNPLLNLAIVIMAGYGICAIGLMAFNAVKERRLFVLAQIGSGFGLCIWAFIDHALSNWPVFLALVFIVSDRLQTRISLKSLAK